METSMWKLPNRSYGNKKTQDSDEYLNGLELPTCKILPYEEISHGTILKKGIPGNGNS